MGSDPLDPTSFGRPEGTAEPEVLLFVVFAEYPEFPLGAE